MEFVYNEVVNKEIQKIQVGINFFVAHCTNVDNQFVRCHLY